MHGNTLDGQCVLITGAAGGVGSAVAARMAKLGARLVLTDRTASELDDLHRELVASGQAMTVAADLSGKAGLAHLFEQVDATLGRVDLLVACAGVGSGPLMEMEDDEWRNVIDTNLVSYVACTRAAIDRMRAAGIRHGQIILVGSISVHIKAVGESVYNASKGGVALFAETLRKELMHEHIRVTLIEPGAIGSAMQPFTPDQRSRLMDEYQLLPPSEVAEAIIFAATRPPGVDVVTLRIEPLIQKIH